nr:flavodoxin [Treponema sp.]
MAKTLIAFFSRAEENYNVGFVKEGNTFKVARILRELLSKNGVDTDLFEIAPAEGYPADYNGCIALAKKELASKARPAIKADIDISGYDTVYLGYPNWWGDIPMCVYTFLEKHDFSGKTVVPFCTHEGSGLGTTESKLKKALPDASFRSGLAVHGIVAQQDEKRTRELVGGWL